MQIQTEILGIDVGATGMKGALVNIMNGELVTERFRLLTPQPATPKAMANTFRAIVKEFKYDGPIGCGFPAIIKKNKALNASNIEASWIGTNVAKTFGNSKLSPIYVLNDADAAAVAEVKFGKGVNLRGFTLLLTIGTGIGSCMFLDGKMIANTELGHLLMPYGGIAEKYCSNSARKELGLNWEDWGKRFNEYLQIIYHLLSPDQIILSGGISKKYDNYKRYFDLPIPIMPAALLNNAGIVGAATYAAMKSELISA